MWRQWFIDLVKVLNDSGGTEGAVSSASGIDGVPPIVVTGKLKNNNVSISVDQFTSNKPGVVPQSGGGITKFLRADGSWATPSVSGYTGTIPLAKITTGGVNGSLVVVNGLITGATLPT